MNEHGPIVSSGARPRDQRFPLSNDRDVNTSNHTLSHTHNTFASKWSENLDAVLSNNKHSPMTFYASILSHNTTTRPNCQGSISPPVGWYRSLWQRKKNINAMSNKHVKFLIKISYAYIVVCAVLFCDCKHNRWILLFHVARVGTTSACGIRWFGVRRQRSWREMASNIFHIWLKYARINWQTLFRRTRGCVFVVSPFVVRQLKCNRPCSTLIYDGNIIKIIIQFPFCCWMSLFSSDGSSSSCESCDKVKFWRVTTWTVIIIVIPGLFLRPHSRQRSHVNTNGLTNSPSQSCASTNAKFQLMKTSELYGCECVANRPRRQRGRGSEWKAQIFPNAAHS